jgi:mannose-6-phosphate isomerase-like protein (cupin superfamily)
MTEFATERRGFRYLNVFEDNDEHATYHGRPNDLRMVHRSPDGRHATFFGGLPEGNAFRENAGNLEETFYIVEGEITCRLEDGEVIVWKAGDLVYWPYTEPMELEYSVGLKCICFFWSDEPLPDFAGDSVTPGAD